jgi:hypothetical protein
MRMANAKSAAIPFKNQSTAGLSLIGTRDISERVSEKIHFDFVAGKNYTSKGASRQMERRVREETAGTRGISLQRKPREIPHSADSVRNDKIRGLARDGKSAPEGLEVEELRWDIQRICWWGSRCTRRKDSGGNCGGCGRESADSREAAHRMADGNVPAVGAFCGERARDAGRGSDAGRCAAGSDAAG